MSTDWIWELQPGRALRGHVHDVPCSLPLWSLHFSSFNLYNRPDLGLKTKGNLAPIVPISQMRKLQLQPSE